MIKMYTNPTCHYCNRIKVQLNEAEIKFEEVIASENQEEWNEVIRITGIGMTPTIIMAIMHIEKIITILIDRFMHFCFAYSAS